MDKENYKLVMTKIPVPVPPLPGLPQHLLKRPRVVRAPLNILAGPNNGFAQNANLAGPSSEQKEETRKDSTFNIDTRFVTLKRGCEDSGYFKAYNDDRRMSEPSVVYVSSDDDREGDEVERTNDDKTDFSSKDKSKTSEPTVVYVISDDDREGDEVEPTNNDKPDSKTTDNKRTSEPNVVCLSSDDDREGDEVERPNYDEPDFSYPRASTSIPAHYMLRPARIKKIKRHRKMPNQDGLDDDRVRCRLSFNFNETTDEEIEAAGPQDLLTGPEEIEDYVNDILSHFLQTEVKPAPPKVHDETRACLINWLMKINDGNPATIQIAIWYLDKMLSSSIVSPENMQLVAAASFWIASKIEGPAVPGSMLVRYANNTFNSLNLLDAELDILMKLKFPSLMVIPQNFLDYMAWWCNSEPPFEVLMAASFVCLCGMMVNKRLCQEYPSVVAAAAVRCALLLLGKKELMPRLQEFSVFVAAENKAESISSICVVLCHAVQRVASYSYPYNYILQLYGTPPVDVAQTIVSAVNELALEVLFSKSS